MTTPTRLHPKANDDLLWGVAYVAARVTIMVLGLWALNRWW